MGLFTTVTAPTGEGVQFKHGEDWCEHAEIGEVYAANRPDDGIYSGISGNMREGWHYWLVACRGGAVIACDPLDHGDERECDLAPDRLAARREAIRAAEAKHGLQWMD